MSNKFLKGVELNEGADQGYFIPNLTGEGAPSESTQGAVGVQYMDIQTGRIYICTAVSNGIYTWESFKGEGGSTEGAVLYTAQTLTEEQKIQARENIGAAAVGEGGNGSPGGYYTPNVTQPNSTTMEVAYTASKSDMPSVASVSIILPAGPQGPVGPKGEPGQSGVKTVNGTAPDENGNVEIETGGSSDGVVLYKSQTLTPEQQAQARENIGAVDASYVDEEIATFDFIKVVDALPETGLPNRFYLVPKTESETQDLFDEYVWVNGAWEYTATKQLEVDLTGYVKDTDYATPSKAGVVRVNPSFGVMMIGENLTTVRAENAQIDAKSEGYRPITPKYLDYAVKVALTTNSIALNDEEKSAAQAWLGIINGDEVAY